MDCYIDEYIRKYSNKGIVVDTNLLLLLYVGSVNRELIAKFKRTAKYIKKDYEVLTDLLLKFKLKYTTPNILTEVSNLANSLKDTFKKQFNDVFVKDINLLEENYIDSSSVSNSDRFMKFGLTDIGIIRLIAGNYLLLTDDFSLAQYASSLKLDVLNFNHIRSVYLTS